MQIGDKVKVLPPFNKAFPEIYKILTDVPDGFGISDTDHIFDPLVLEVVE